MKSVSFRAEQIKQRVHRVISYVQRRECTEGTGYMCSMLTLIAASDTEDKQPSHTSLCLIRPGDKQQHFISYKMLKYEKKKKNSYSVRHNEEEARRLEQNCRNNVQGLCQDKWERRWEEEEPQLIASPRFNQQRLWFLIPSWSQYE